ncbi:MAG: D-2-hydroxyacid dehydrogenase [Dehalococcoidia bacterium]
MPGNSAPVLILSAHFAERYGDELAAAAPDAAIVRHDTDGRWDGDPDTGTIGLMSSDMWATGMAPRVLEQFAEMKSLRWLQTSSAGVDRPVYARLLARGVILTNRGSHNSIPVAQHVLALMLARARRLSEYRELQAERLWKRLAADELTEATVLIVGLGDIGREVARLCRVFGMRVLGMRRRAAPDPLLDEVLPADRLREVLPRADYVVLACPLTEATRGLIDAGALAAMKPTAYLINVARGPVVDAQALAAALHAGCIGGAALDVFTPEPLPADSPLWSVPNLTITPHGAASSPLGPERGARNFLDNLARYVRGESLQNLVLSVE